MLKRIKNKIMEMVLEGNSIAKITKEVKLEKQEVQNFIDDVYNGFSKMTTVENYVPGAGERVVPETYDSTLGMLKSVGFKTEDAVSLLDRTIRKLDEVPVDPNQLKDLCLQNISARETMIRKTESGRGGVSIMTETSSKKGDNIRNRPVQQQGIYKIKK